MTKEIRLSKAQGAAYTPEQMARFLRVLERWCEAQGRSGRTVRPNPDPGPGTMRWTAERER